LEQAKALVIPIRFYQSDPRTDIMVIAQFGVLAEEGSGGAENPGHIVEVPIFYNLPLSDSWIKDNNLSHEQYVAVELDDDMRRKLQSANSIRLLVINTHPGPSGPGTAFSNRLVVGKPYVMGTSWRAITVNGGAIQAAPDTVLPPFVKAAEVRAPDLSNDKIRRLHETGMNHVLQVEWNITTPTGGAGADGRTSAAPLSNYRVLSFFFKGGNIPAVGVPVAGIPGGTFRFFVARGPEAYANSGRRALDLEVTVPSGTSFVNDQSWHSVEIHYGAERQRLLVDGAEFPAVINYRPEALRDSAAGLENFAGSGQSAYMAVLFEHTAASTGTFYIDEICLEDPAPSYRVNGGATLDWRRPEALLSVGDRAVISGAAFNTALESAARGDPFNSRAETFTGLQSRSRGEITVLDTRLTGNLSFMVSSDVSYWSAGHGISRSFGPLLISETFNTAPPPNDETMNHQVSLSLSTPLSVQLSSMMTYQNRRLNRTWNGSTVLRAKQNGRPGFSLEGTLGYLERTERPLEWMAGYAESWVQSWPVLVPDRGASAGAAAGRGIQNRNARGRAGFTLDLLPVGADLSFEGRSAVSVPMKRTQSGSTARADFPFTLGPLRGNLRSQRDISRTLGVSGPDIADDMLHYGKSLSETSPLWRTIPVFALFDPGLGSAMDDARSSYWYAGAGENLRFQEILGLNLLFPERYDFLSLLIPVSHSTQLDRTMDQRLDTRLDVLTVSSGFGFSSINLFGAMGSHPVFSVYRNDEFRHSVSGVFSFPRGEKPLWRLQAEQSLGVYGFKGAELGVTNTWTMSSSGWIESFGLLWTIPREKSLLSAVYEAGMGRLEGQGNFPALSDLAASEYERLFRESLEFVIDKSDRANNPGGLFTAQAGHESVVRILGKLTLSGFVKVGFRRDAKAELLGFLLSFGTTLNVSF
jgi:hypothetical protein